MQLLHNISYYDESLYSLEFIIHERKFINVHSFIHIYVHTNKHTTHTYPQTDTYTHSLFLFSSAYVSFSLPFCITFNLVTIFPSFYFLSLSHLLLSLSLSLSLISHSLSPLQKHLFPLQCGFIKAPHFSPSLSPIPNIFI